MSTPGGLPARIQGEVIQPSAVIDPQSEAVHNLGQVLSTLVHRSVGAFHTEGEQDAAQSAVERWVNSQVNHSVRSALAEESPVRASKEDVSQRTPPNQVGPTQVSGQAIDYARLAAAIVAAQQQHAAELNQIPEGE